MKLLLLFAVFTIQAKLALQTYNTGLAHTYVPSAPERLPLIIENLKSSSSDVLCLQEVWRKGDREQFIAQLKEIYPHSFAIEAKQKFAQHAPVCSISNFVGTGKFGNCLVNNCLSRNGDGLTSCVINKCKDSLDRLKVDNNDCAAALISQVGKNLVKGLASIFNPFKKVGLLAYEGEAGLLVLSKHPIKNQQIIDFSEASTTNRRAALISTIQGVRMACTHLTANLEKDIPYTGHFKNWQEENENQIQQILEYFSTLESDVPQVIMGDMNVGPKELTSNYELFRNFEDPARDTQGCTFCPAKNPLISNEEIDVLIDHIFVKNLEVRSAQINMTKFEKIKDKFLPLSDHFGVEVIIK